MKLLLCVAFLCWPMTTLAQQLIIEGRQFDNLPAIHDFLIEPLGAEEGQARYQARYLKTAALLEYVKYDPVGARDIALAQMAKPDPDIDANGLLFLDDAMIPELTDAFRANLKGKTFHYHAAVVERYGTPDLLPDVIGLYKQYKGKWACEIAEHYLGFIVKHDRARGLMFVEEAVSLRADTGCYHDVMEDALKSYPGPDVLALASKYVGDSDEEIAATSATLVAIQDGGKDRLREMMTSKQYHLSPKTRLYIETQLRAAPK